PAGGLADRSRAQPGGGESRCGSLRYRGSKRSRAGDDADRSPRLRLARWLTGTPVSPAGAAPFGAARDLSILASRPDDTRLITRGSLASDQPGLEPEGSGPQAAQLA